MQHFQSILIIIGILAILAVLVHGYLVSRKEKISAAELTGNDESLSKETEEDEQDGIIGDVNIIHYGEEDDIRDLTFSDPDDEIEDIKFSTEELDQEIISLDNQSFAEDDQKVEMESKENQPEVEIEKKEPEQQDHFIFNVAAKDGKYVRGHELLQFFLTAGFRFGEMSIFHRHLHSDGTGPILFSIANMMQPGIFEPENMEQFQSEGVSFFLTVPNDDINVKEAFNMMVIAVEQMAEEFDCEVLNDKRQLLTTDEYRVYQERLLRYI